MNLILPIYSIFLLVLLQIIFYSKERINNSETKIYKYMMIISSINIFLNILGIYCGYNFSELKFFTIINHFDLPLYFWWASLLLLYLISVYVKDKNKYSIIRKIILFLDICFTIISIFLPFEVIISKTEGYAIGVCVNFVYSLSAIYILSSIIMAIIIIKKGMIKKASPVIALLVLGSFAALIQKSFPNLIIIPSVIAFIELIMFFTIENPDVKILEEYNKNRELVEKNIEDRSNLLFKISEDIKFPIKQIKDLSYDIINDKTNNLTKDTAKNIYSLASGISNMVNDVLNISLIDKQNIEISDSSYNVYNLFNQIIYIIKNKINNDNEFKYSISNIIPEKLYGDSTKIKQIICSIVFNALSVPKNGNVDLDVTAIVKYDICRLIITITNGKSEMSLTEIDDILGSKNELSKDEFNKINDLDINLKSIKKIIDVLGGTLFIKSDKGVGTTFRIVLNQLIKEDKVKNVIEATSKNLSNKKRVLIVDDDFKELDKISKELKNNNFEVETTMYGKDVLVRLENNQEYNLIFIDDEMKPINAVEIIKHIKNNNNVIIMLDKDKEKIKENYINDYNFTDYLLKDNYKEEIKRIKEKLK
jgi:CheY-like chemotaxis protein/signal transduction histidine kinase